MRAKAHIQGHFITAAMLALVLLTVACERNDLAESAQSDTEAQATERETIGPADMDDAASLVLRGGKVITVDPMIGEVEAIAVKGSEIWMVGKNAEISAFIGPETEVIELDGRTVIPGFIEGHGHFLMLGWAKQNLDLTKAQTWDEIVGMVAGAAEEVPEGAWISGFGWHQDKWLRVPETAVEGVPRNDAINDAAPNNPVLLTHASGHASIANDAALTAAGIGDLTEDPPGGTIVRAADGKATGLLRETAQDDVERARAEWDAQRSAEEKQAEKREQVMLAGEEALRYGVTSFQDAGTSFADIDLLRQLEEEGVLPVRLYVMVRYQRNAEMDAQLPDYYMPAGENDFLVVRSIKRQIDGALGTHGAWLLEPYTDLPSTSGLVLEPVEEIEETADIAVRHGFQLNTHAIGTRANRETLDIYQRAFLAHDVDGNDLRWRIEHAQHLDPADIPRFKELGVIASMQGVHATSDGPWLPTRLGQERADQTSYVWRNLLDAGAMINNGTDVPVESIDPIASFYSSVSRVMNNGEKLTPAMAMTREEALESYTINNAYAAFEEDMKGSLRPGKLADMVVLSQDIMTVPESQIPETRVDYTIVGGEIRYSGQD
jgi:predicted amidohydrolase YtcJ